MKICKIIWSTNRLEFLIPTLETSQQFIDWGDHEVDGVFIDDMPTDRNDELIKTIAESHGYNHVILHKENKGITYTCQEGYDFIQKLEKEYDFIWHQEDDLIISEHIKIDDLITYFNENKTINQVTLPYQMDWYATAEETGRSVKDLPLVKYNNYHIVNAFHFNESSNFDTSFSLTRANILFGALNEWHGGKLSWVDRLGPMYEAKEYSEASLYHVVAAYSSLMNGSEGTFNYKWGTSFYDSNKNAFVEHIGEWSWGQRLTPEMFESKIKELNENPEKYKESYNYHYQLARLQEMAENPSAKINSKTWKRL